jgi:hypothetical protein
VTALLTFRSAALRVIVAHEHEDVALKDGAHKDVVRNGLGGNA